MKQIAFDVWRDKWNTTMPIKRLARIPLWVPLMLVGVLFFQIKGVVTSPDAARYMAIGLNLFQGRGYLESDWTAVTFRGPVFPGLIALAFSLFGVSVKSALGVVRLFLMLNVLLVYILGVRWFNRGVGLAAALLILTSFSLHRYSSYVLLDNILPFFILLTQLLLVMAFETGRLSKLGEAGGAGKGVPQTSSALARFSKIGGASFETRRNVYFALAGLALGVAFLTKDSAIFFLPLPLLLWLWLPASRPGRVWRGMLLFWVVAGSLIGLWLMYVAYHNRDFTSQYRYGVQVVFGSGLSQATGSQTEEAPQSDSSPAAILSSQVGQTWRQLVAYYQTHFAANFILAPFFLLAWGCVSYKALLKRSPPDIYLLSGFLLFLPLLIFLAKKGNFRDGQSFYLYLLSYLALARILWPAGLRRLPHPQVWGAVGLALALTLQIWGGRVGFIQLLTNSDPTGFMPPANSYALSLGQDRWEVRGWHGPAVREAGRWLAENTLPGDPILMDWYWADSLYFYLEGRGPIYKIDYIASTGSVEAEAQAAPLFIWTQGGAKDLMQHDIYLNILTEPQLLTQIHQFDIKYVAVTPYRNFIALYLRANPGFKSIRQFDRGNIQIFEVNTPVSPATFQPHLEPAALPYLRQLATGQPVLYQQILQINGSEEVDGGEPRQTTLPRPPPGSFEPIEIWQIYDRRNQAQTFLGRGEYQQAVAVYQELITLEPDWAAPRIELAQAFQRRGESDRAIAELQEAVAFYEQIIETTPDDIQAYWALGQFYQALEQEEAAIAVYTQVVEQWPDQAETFLRLGQMYEIQGDLGAATAAYETAVAVQPALAEGYAALAGLYGHQDSGLKTVELYRQAARLNPTAAWPHLELGQLYLVEQ